MTNPTQILHPSFICFAMDQSDPLEAFFAVTGATRDAESESRALHLLDAHTGDLNGAVSTFFDSGFEVPSTRIESPPNVAASGLEVHNEDAAHLSHRHANNDPVNLQSQMFMDDLLPRLPKAPRIQNHWQLEIGLHLSQKEDMPSAASTLVNDVRSPWSTIWVVLLFVPKTILHLVVSLVRLVFRSLGPGVVSKGVFKQKFDDNAFNHDYSFLNWLAYTLTSESAEADSEKSELKTVDAREKGDDETLAVLEHEERSFFNKDRVPSPLDAFKFAERDFNAVHHQSQSQYEWLLVLLVDSSDESTALIKNLILDTSFNKLFNKVDGIHKGATIYINNVARDPEAHEVCKTYKFKRLPCVMLIGNVTNNPSVMASMSIVYKTNVSALFLVDEDATRSVARKILKNLSKSLDTYNPQLVSMRFDKQEIEISRMLKDEQDNAYLESLEKDKFKKFAKEKEIEEARQLQEATKTRNAFLAHIVRSDWFATTNKNASLTTKIAFKLPDGRRIVEVVLKELSVNEVYLFIELKLFAAEEGKGEEELEGTPAISHEEYFSRFTFKFELIQPFPKKVVSASSAIVGEVPELKSGANLLVEYLEEDEN